MRRIVVLAVLMLSPSTSLFAQSLGTFHWQTQPFCNVLTLAVTVAGQSYRLEGTDDGCAGTKASVIGMAYPKADGSIGVGLTIVSTGAVALHMDATILPGAGFNGSWTDSAGRTGTWLLTPGGSLGGPVRPIVSVLQYGASVVQPTGGSDRGLSVAVSNDTGVAGDAAALYGRFGAALPPGLEGPAGVRGESAASAGVFGRSDSGIGIVGGTNTGVGVQGHAVAASGMGVQAHHVNGGTALEISNGAIRVAGAIRAAFVFTAVGGFGCEPMDHPLLNNDPNALVFVTSRNGRPMGAGYQANNRWVVCDVTNIPAGARVSVLVIKQP